MIIFLETIIPVIIANLISKYLTNFIFNFTHSILIIVTHRDFMFIL